MSRRHYVGIFCISLATLLLELAFTRVLAVASWYHFAFLIISMALLGFGISGVVLTLWEWEASYLKSFMRIEVYGFGHKIGIIAQGQEAEN